MNDFEYEQYENTANIMKRIRDLEMKYAEILVRLELSETKGKETVN